jgi:membrane fusion protein (multidrug efflux system)
LKTAEINLAYTDINSPIDGRIGRTAVTRGNVVGPDSGVLTTIVSSNPMYVTFRVSQREFIRIFPPGQNRQRQSTIQRLSSSFRMDRSISTLAKLIS